MYRCPDSPFPLTCSSASQDWESKLLHRLSKLLLASAFPLSAGHLAQAAPVSELLSSGGLKAAVVQFVIDLLSSLCTSPKHAHAETFLQYAVMHNTMKIYCIAVCFSVQTHVCCSELCLVPQDWIASLMQCLHQKVRCDRKCCAAKGRRGDIFNVIQKVQFFFTPSRSEAMKRQFERGSHLRWHSWLCIKCLALNCLCMFVARVVNASSIFPSRNLLFFF